MVQNYLGGMKSDPPLINFLFIHKNIYNVALLLIWKLITDLHPRIYNLFLLFPFTLIPYIGKIHGKIDIILIVCEEILSLLSISLTNLLFYEQIFFTFFHKYMISAIFKREMFSLVYILIYAFFHYSLQLNDHLDLALITINAISQLALILTLPKELQQKQFPIQSLIISLLIENSLNGKIHKHTYLMVIILGLKNYIPSFIFSKFTAENRTTLFYILLSFLLNIYGVIFGIKYGSPSCIGASSLSCFNALSLSLALIADLVSRNEATVRFSYGFSRIKVLLHFTGSLMLLYAAFSVASEAFASLAGAPIYVTKPLPVVLISAADFLITLLGTLYMGNMTITEFFANASVPLLCDIVISSAALISSLLDAVFGMPGVDPYVSLFISSVIVATVVPELATAIPVLMQASPRRVSKYRFKTRFELAEVIEMNLWKAGNNRSVLTMRARCEDRDTAEVREELAEYLSNRSVEDTCIEVI